MSITKLTIENAEEIESLLRKHKFVGTNFRTNVASNDETYTTPQGRVVLKKKIKSDIKKEGELFDAVVKHHPWVEQLTLNKNLKCTRHTDRNEGESLIAFFGDFTGGGLFVETPEGTEHLTEKGVWYQYNGRHPHWTEDFEGNRWSIVAYKKPKPKSSKDTTLE